jgi:hypothetical protein
VLGGLSKCHICEEIECLSDTGVCELQLQGVNSTDMSQNIPTVSDTAWAVGGAYRHDYGGKNVTHFCVFTSPAHCALPETRNFTDCQVRCFGHGFSKPAVKLVASKRSVTDVYPGMGRWKDDGAVDLWSYPKNCDDLHLLHGQTCTYSGSRHQIPSYNPQGFTFTYSGSGRKGFIDGTAAVAEFNGPEDVAVDEHGVLYVADTQNNAIRVIKHDGSVHTLAGLGPASPGYVDGDCSVATFALPKGLDVRHETVNGASVVRVIVADTGNHRIRRITYNEVSGTCHVACLTGLCGNNSLSATEFHFPAKPLTGYADGNGLEARFSAPESVAYMEGDYFVVADTGNFLLRWVIASNGTTQTLAGTVVDGPKDPAGNPLPGCTPPCMVGKQVCIVARDRYLLLHWRHLLNTTKLTLRVVSFFAAVSLLCMNITFVCICCCSCSCIVVTTCEVGKDTLRFVYTAVLRNHRECFAVRMNARLLLTPLMCYE